MSEGIELIERPENLTDLNTIDQIIRTFEQLKQEHSCNYVLAHLQEGHLGETYRFIPEGFVPSRSTQIIAKYNKGYFTRKKREVQVF